MNVSYKPLRYTLVKCDMNISELCLDLGISSTIRAKLNNDSGYVSLEIIERICLYLNEPIQNIVEITS